jgi:6-phosphogluconolactonase
MILIVGSLGSGETPGGIQVYRLDGAASSATLTSSTSDIAAPSFASVDLAASRLYAVDETRAGTLVVYALDALSGRLAEIGRQATLGDSPCHVALDRSRRFALVSNFGMGAGSIARAQSLAILPVNDRSGLSPAVASVAHTRSSGISPHQDAPHGHCAITSADNRFLFATNYGGDQVLAYPFDPNSGTLGDAASICEAPEGSGPRTIVLAPDGATAFVSCELSSSIATLDIDRASGQLSILGMAATLPHGSAGENYPAETRLGPDGRFLYVSNRGHDSISVFAVEDKSIHLVAVHSSGGSWPRCFDISADGRRMVVANQKSGEIVMFVIDPRTGELGEPKMLLIAAAPAFVGLVTPGG